MNPKLVKKLKENISKDLYNGILFLATSLQTLDKGPNSIMNDKKFLKIQDRSEDGLYRTSFSDDGEKDFMPSWIRPSEIYPVTDRNAFETFKTKSAELLEDMEESVHMLSEKKVISDKSAEYMQAAYFDSVRRALKGYGTDYLCAKSPLGDNFTQFTGAAIDERNLNRNIAKWNEKCPVWDLVIESNRQQNTFARYIKEREQGRISEKREADFRRKLYSETLKMLEMTKKVDDAVSNKELHDEMVKDHLFGNDPFHISSLAVRGIGPFVAVQEAYKTGLEQGWALDDIPALASFKQLLEILERKAICNAETDLDKFEFYDKPNYKNPGGKDIVDRMKSFCEMIEEIPLHSEEDTVEESKKKRDEILLGMKELVDELKRSKGTLYEEARKITQCFDGYYKEARERDPKIQYDEEKAFGVSVKGKELIGSEVFRHKLNNTNSGIDMNEESKEHREFREAEETVLRFTRLQEKVKSGQKKFTDDERTAYLENCLQALDDLVYRADQYMASGVDKNVENGLDLRKIHTFGVRQFAGSEREKLFKEAMDNKLTLGAKDLNDFRMNVAAKKWAKAVKTLSEMPEMPKANDTPAIKKFMIASANILVGRLAFSEHEPSKKAVQTMGLGAVKSEILDDKDFRKMIVGFLRDKRMTPAQVAEKLTKANPVELLKTISHKNVKQAQKKAEVIRKHDKKMAARQLAG